MTSSYLSPADDASDIFSLYSYPMTRGSTSDGSEPLPTPMDYAARQQQSKPSVSGPRSMSSRRQNDILVRAYSEASDAVRSRYADATTLDMVPETQEYMSPQNYGPEPYEEYFSMPVVRSDVEAGRTSLQRRKSTKELINRFESMTSESGSSAGGHPQAHSIIPSSPTRPAQSSFTPHAKTERKTSPLRNSFRSLISVFKKGKKSKDRYDSYLTLPKLDTLAGSVEPSSSVPANDRRVQSTGGHENVTAAPGSRICASPTAYALHSGPLLHLSRPSPSSSSILPVWMACDVVLHTTHLLLTAPTSHGIAATEIVSLSACSDVRSLTVADMDAEEQALLPAMDEAENPKVFELLFSGKEHQRFACPSVKDRAAWVSTIWDAVLQAQDKQILERRKSQLSTRLHINTSATASESAAASPPMPSPMGLLPSPPPMTYPTHPPSSGGSSISQTTRASEMNVPSGDEPPTPPTKTESVLSSRSADTASHASRMSSPRPRSAASDRLSPGVSPPSRAPSPSILNLDQRSVVKQRLAEMQQVQLDEARSTATRSARSSESRVSSTLMPPSRLTSVRSSLRAAVPSTRNTSVYSKIVSSELDTASRLTSPVSTTSDGMSLSQNRPKSAFRIREEMRQRDRIEHKRWASASAAPSTWEMERSNTAGSSATERPAPSQYQGSVLEADDVGALLNVIDVHAERQILHTAEIGDQINAVHEDVKDVAENVRAAISERGQDSRNIAEMRDALELLRDTVLRSRAREGGVTSADMAQLGDQLAALADDQVPSDGRDVTDNLQILRMLQEIRETLKIDQQESTGASECQSPTVAIFSNERPSTFARARPMPPAPPPEFIEIQQKLDMLLSISKGPVVLDKRQVPGSLMKDTEGGQMLQEIISLLHNDEGQRALQMEQQADSIRYLNELNTWLEAFVSSGTAQIQAVAQGVQKLCEDMGSSEMMRNVPKSDGESADQQTLLGSLQQLLAEGEVRDRNSANLHSTIDGLVIVLNEDMRKNAEMREAYTTESVMGFIDRQRQDQERMLRTLASELSDDIRGERLRFVEAMKEATAINVQIHVEEFKKELTREVLYATQEVDRLQRERQNLEQQIADLFAFYAKQKQAAAPQRSVPPPASGPSRASSRRRALPHPPPSHRS